MSARLLLLLMLLTGCSSASAPPASIGKATAPAKGGNHATPKAPIGGPTPQFQDVADLWGVRFRREDDYSGEHRIHEGPGGGVAVLDFDLDHRPDILFANGCRLPVPPTADSPGSPLFQNRGGQFIDVQQQAGLTARGYLTGVAVGDMDSDGFPDLFIAAFHQAFLFLNTGDGQFEDRSDLLPDWGLRWNTSAAWGDLNGDSHPDLYVVTYVDADDKSPRLCPEPRAPDGFYQCPPTMFPAEQDVLLLNTGDGGFIDSTAASGIAGPDGKGLGVVLSDLNQDGRLDIFVTNDGVANHLYLNEAVETDAAPPRPRFREAALDQGCALSETGAARAGMGIAAGDYDRDGFIDLHVTNFFAEKNALFHNLAGESFRDETDAVGIASPSLSTLGWGTVFIDFDHNGWPDLFVANGHINDLSWSNTLEKFRMPPQFFRNEEGVRFTDVSSTAGTYFEQELLGRGVAMGDLDGDLDQDLVISQQLGPSAVLANTLQTENHVIRLKLVGAESNRDGVGARVQLTGESALFEVTGGGGFQAANDPEIEIGLGSRTAVPPVEIHWPSGQKQVVNDLPIDVRSIIVEGLAGSWRTPSSKPQVLQNAD
jgi:hypothetical protein